MPVDETSWEANAMLIKREAETTKARLDDITTKVNNLILNQALLKRDVMLLMTGITTVVSLGINMLMTLTKTTIATNAVVTAIGVK